MVNEYSHITHEMILDVLVAISPFYMGGDVYELSDDFFITIYCTLEEAITREKKPPGWTPGGGVGSSGG